MYPELFSVGPFVIHTYGVLLALAFFIGIAIARNRALTAGESEEIIINLSYIVIIASVIGARFFYVVFHLSEFTGRWKYTIWPIQEDGTIGIGGLILLGGVIFGITSSWVYLRYKKRNFMKYADIVTPIIPLGIFLGRLGCFLNGCCFGHTCHLPWAVSFPSQSPAGAVMGNVGLHPTQLYESGFNLVLFVLIMMISKKYNRQDGTLFGIFLIGYGAERFIVDFFRYYETQMFIVPGVDFNQIISVIMVLAGCFLIFKLKPWYPPEQDA